MLKFRKVTFPAHREFYLVCRGNDYYNGQVYRTERLAQKDADAMNNRRDTEKYGAVTVAFKDFPESNGYTSNTIRL